MRINIYFGILILVFYTYGGSTEFQVNNTAPNTVKFISDAPMEDFEGITNKIDGYIFWNGDKMLEESEIYFEVDLNSLDTGIGLRNRHMRDNYLETEQFPYTHFTGKLIGAEKITENEYAVKAEGVMFIHGVKKNLIIEGSFNKTDNGFRVISNFIIPLSDYNIKVPQIMFFKIDENMKIEVDFFIKKVE